jgi:hypothetical protein
MNPEEHQRMTDLCQRIQVEQNPTEFTMLVDELNALLGQKEKRLENAQQKSRPEEQHSMAKLTGPSEENAVRRNFGSGE